MGKRLLVILTLEHHRDGIWITRLVDALNSVLDETKNREIQIQVFSLELLLTENRPDTLYQDWHGLVNRVSDAAPPSLYKSCLAVLYSAMACNVKVWNGPASYATCGNKWCHHVLFQQAGLCAPETRIVFNKNEADADKDEISRRVAKDIGFPLLIKPNAGGFGKGMVRIERAEDLTQKPDYEDGMSLYQEYVGPQNDENYRVWFLHGKVQCGVVRKIDNMATEFTSACVGGVCSRPASARENATPSTSRFESWKVPHEVVAQIEEQLLPLLPDAHAGSVEFLYTEQGQRLYFDLNLLSTLPTDNVNNSKGTWPKDYDPWKEMAYAILNYLTE